MSTNSVDIEIESINRLKVVLVEQILVKIVSILKVDPRKLLNGNNID